MTDAGMPPDRFKQLLQTYGGKLERWPEEQRVAAATLLADSLQAQAWLEAAQRLDRLLDTPAEIALSPALQARIGAIPARYPRAHSGSGSFLFGGFRRPLLALAASAFGGVVSGWWSVSADDGASDRALEANALASPGAEELNGLLAIAFGWDLESDAPGGEAPGLSEPTLPPQDTPAPDYAEHDQEP